MTLCPIWRLLGFDIFFDVHKKYPLNIHMIFRRDELVQSTEGLRGFLLQGSLTVWSPLAPAAPKTSMQFFNAGKNRVFLVFSGTT